MKHLHRDPQTWEELRELGSMALWLEELENQKLKALFGVQE